MNGDKSPAQHKLARPLRERQQPPVQPSEMNAGILQPRRNNPARSIHYIAVKRLRQVLRQNQQRPRHRPKLLFDTNARPKMPPLSLDLNRVRLHRPGAHLHHVRNALHRQHLLHLLRPELHRHRVLLLRHRLRTLREEQENHETTHHSSYSAPRIPAGIVTNN